MRKFVYFISDGKYVKIGVSNNPVTRLKSLQTAHPLELFIVKLFDVGDNAFEIESFFHKAFANKSVRNEWFDIDANDAKNVYYKQYNEFPKEVSINDLKQCKRRKINPFYCTEDEFAEYLKTNGDEWERYKQEINELFL